MATSRRILAIETSGRMGSAAIGTAAGVLAVRQLDGEMRHASQFLPTVQALAAEQGWAPDSLTDVFVSIGPGSFTGLRIGVTVARTLGWATGTRIVAVPTLDALARNALLADRVPEYAAAVLDAKRGQVYGAAFRLTDGGIERVLGPVLEDTGPFLARCPRPLAVLGEGVSYHRAAIDAADVTVLDAALWPGRAENVLAVGLEMAAAGQFTAPGDLLPLYIRRPEAEEKWERLHPPAESG